MNDTKHTPTRAMKHGETWARAVERLTRERDELVVALRNLIDSNAPEHVKAALAVLAKVKP